MLFIQHQQYRKREWQKEQLLFRETAEAQLFVGAVQIDGTVTVGVDDTGLDVKFFGATAGSLLVVG